MVAPNKGWAIGRTGLLLEYDGVFWNKVTGIEPAGRFDYIDNHLISVIDTDEVWFVNGYRYRKGRYEKHGGTFSSIRMINSQSGIAILSPNNYDVYVYRDTIWTSTSVRAWSVAIDDRQRIWYSKADGGRGIVRAANLSTLMGEAQGIPSSSIESDPEGDIWLVAEQIGHVDQVWSVVDYFPVPFNSTNTTSLIRWSSRSLFGAYHNYNSGDGGLFKGTVVFPALTSSAREIHFESVPAAELPEVNAQVRRDLFIRNAGEGALKIRDIASDGEMFRFQAESFTQPSRSTFDLTKGRVPPGDSLRVVIVYLPTEPGQHNGRLVIESNDRTNPTYTINLSGATLGSIGPRIFVPSSLQFDSTFADQAQRSTLRIRNSGRGYLSVSSISSDNPAFKVPGDTLLVPPLTSRSIEVVFAPAVGGENRGQITILSDDPVSPEVKVALRGAGVIVPEGPISLDSYLAAGDQRRRIVGNSVPGMVYTFQLNVANAPEIQGWSATIEYDPGQVRYVKDSFQSSSFIPGLVTLVDENDDGISIGGTVLGSDARKSGDGALGTLSFEVQEGFRDSTHLVVREVSFHRTDGVEDKRTVWSVATITWEPVPGPLRGDFNGDDEVSFDDFFLFADGFGSTDPLLDLNGNGAVDFDDFFLFADNFGTEFPGMAGTNKGWQYLPLMLVK